MRHHASRATDERGPCPTRYLSASVLMLALIPALRPGPVEVAEVVKEVREEAASFRRVAKHLQGEIVCRTTVEVAGEAPRTFQHTNEFKMNARCALWIETNGPVEKPMTRALCVNPQYGFTLSKDAKGWRVRTVELAKPDAIQYGGKPLVRHVLDSVTLQYPYELLDDKIITVHKAEAVEKDHRRLIVFRHEYRIEPRGDFPAHSGNGALWLDPGVRLSLRYVSGTVEYPKEKATSNVMFEYDGGIKGFPKLKRRSGSATVTEQNGTVRRSESVTEYTLRYDEGVPDAAFTLSAFGLPEPVAGVP